MAETFVSLASYVRGGAAAEPPPVAESVPVQGVAAIPPASVAGCGVEFVHAEVHSGLTLVRLAAFEAFERAKMSLLAALAQEVLGRELALAPADVEALVARAGECFREFEPLSITLSAADAARVGTSLPTFADASLEAGDVVIAVRDGAFESLFRFRLQAALAGALFEVE